MLSRIINNVIFKIYEANIFFNKYEILIDNCKGVIRGYSWLKYCEIKIIFIVLLIFKYRFFKYIIIYLLELYIFVLFYFVKKLFTKMTSVDQQAKCGS